MIPTDWRQKNAEELKKILGEKSQALRAFRFGLSGSKTTNVKAGRNLRQDIARLLTLLNSRL